MTESSHDDIIIHKLQIINHCRKKKRKEKKKTKSQIMSHAQIALINSCHLIAMFNIFLACLSHAKIE